MEGDHANPMDLASSYIISYHGRAVEGKSELSHSEHDVGGVKGTVVPFTSSQGHTRLRARVSGHMASMVGNNGTVGLLTSYHGRTVGGRGQE